MFRYVVTLLLLALCGPATAEDWSVERTRGDALQQVDGSWVVLARGDVVPDDRLLKTGADGRVGLRRGAESIEMGGDTQIRVHDAGDAMMTTVLQDYGTVAVEAERRNVQHFSVQTPFLAAVVKGTRFTVTFDGDVAQVSVERGTVQVQDQLHSLVTDITPGHDATVSKDEALAVSGIGATPIYAFEGQTAIAIAPPAGDTDHSDNGKHNGNAHGVDNGNDNRGNNANQDHGNSAGAENGGGDHGNQGQGNSGGSGNGNNGNGNADGAGNGNGNQGLGNAGGAGNGNNGNGNGNGADNGTGNQGQGNAGGAGNGNNSNGNGNSDNGNTGNPGSGNPGGTAHANNGNRGND